jgi:hypothetical protein
MHHIPALAEVKPISQLAKLEAKLKGIGDTRRYGRFTRAQIEELKLALAPHYLTLCRRLLPCSGVLSRTEDYLHVPALDISINLKTGDFFRLPFDLREPHRLGDFISLYGMVENLSFRQAMAALGRIAMDVGKIFLTSNSKENARDKKRIVHAAFFGKNGENERALSALAIRKRVGAYLAAHPEHYPKVKEKHPEFFYGTAFARLLREWASEPPEEAEFFRIVKRPEGKNLAFLLQDLTENQ